MNRRFAVLLLPAAVAAGLLAAACGRAPELGPGEARLGVDGVAIVVRADGTEQRVDTVALLRRGDRVTVVEGTGWLEMAGDTTLAARAAGGRSADTSLVMDEAPALLAGDLLVEAGEPLRVDTGPATVEVAASAAHLRRSYSTAVAVYTGAASVESAGREVAVPALREAQVSAPGRVPAHPRPMRYDATDEWDRRFLGDAIALGEELRDRARAYTATLAPGEGRTPGFFELLLPRLGEEPAFGGDLLEDWRTPGETLVGAAITVLGEGDGFRDRWGEVFEFRDEGAAWGLVAMDQGVDADPLRATIEQALNATSYEFAAPADAARLAARAGAGAAGGGLLGVADGTGPGGIGGPGGSGGPDGPGGSDGPGGPDGPGTGGPGDGDPGDDDDGGGDDDDGGITIPTVTSLTIPPGTDDTVDDPGDPGDDDIIDDIVDPIVPGDDPLPTTLPPTTVPPLPTTLPPLTTTTTIRLPTTTTTIRLPLPTTTTIRLPTTTTTIRLPPLP